jgi:protein required for attachment to host cells
MTNIKLDKDAVVVVCDGRKAMILENAGDARFPNLRLKYAFEHEDKRTQELGVSPPGRSHQSIGHHRSAVEQTDWYDEAERTFLRTLATRLDTEIAQRSHGPLIVVAAPRALGMLRDAYSPAVRKAVAAEVAKDMVKMPIHEIEKALAAQA